MAAWLKVLLQCVFSPFIALCRLLGSCGVAATINYLHTVTSVFLMAGGEIKTPCRQCRNVRQSEYWNLSLSTVLHINTLHVSSLR